MAALGYVAPPRPSHGFPLALILSLALHVAFGAALGFDAFVRFLQPKAVRVLPPEPRPVRFTLVETPDSAVTDTPPEESRFVSDRHTRAQDTIPDASSSAEDQPRILDDGEAHDLRQLALAPAMAVPEPPPPAPAAILVPQAPPEPSEVEVEAPQPSPAPSEPIPEMAPPAPAAVVQVPDHAPPVPDNVRPGAEAVRDTEPEPVESPAEVQPLPKKQETMLRRQLAKLERELAALREATAAQPGQVSLSEVEAAELANARIRGEFSYGATQHFFGEYLLTLKAEVEREWFSRLLTDYSRVLHSRVVIDFKVYANGAVHDLAVVESTGDEYFPVLCVHAITAAAPFDPVPYARVEGIPAQLSDKPLNIRFTFQYN